MGKTLDLQEGCNKAVGLNVTSPRLLITGFHNTRRALEKKLVQNESGGAMLRSDHPLGAPEIQAADLQ